MRLHGTPYAQFANSVKRKRRHILDDKQNDFISLVLKTSESRTFTHPNTKLLWRAQKGFKGYSRGEQVTEVPDGLGGLQPEVFGIQHAIPYCIKRMKPLADKAKEARANCKGIPALYCSTDRDTAMNELRPWIGEMISLAEIMFTRPLKLVDCTLDSLNGLEYAWTFSCPDATERIIWSDLNDAFSEPITDTDDTADYAPTQVLAEAFKYHGFDGIQYGSKVGEGKTIAVFYLDLALVVSRCVFEVENRSLTFGVQGGTFYEPAHPQSQTSLNIP